MPTRHNYTAAPIGRILQLTYLNECCLIQKVLSSELSTHFSNAAVAKNILDLLSVAFGTET